MRKGVILLLILVFLIASNIATPLPVKAEPTTIVVPDDYPTIQDAIDHGNAGDTVFVKAGNYSLPADWHGIDIDKSISLIGENKQNTIITQEPYKYNEAAIRISADNVTTSGFTIKKGVMHNIAIDGSDCKIMNNNILNSYGNGIDASGSNNTIFENNIAGNHGFGIYMSSSDSLISKNNIANNNVGIIIDSCKNVTISQNNITGNGEGGLALRWNGPFFIEENNISDNQGFGIQFGEGTNNATVCKNNIIANQYGFNLLNYITNPLGITSLGFGNQVYYNNIVNNHVNANVEYTCIFTANVSEGEGNGTDVVLWDNGLVGNYWSDYESQGAYVIDGNNVDHYPLTQQVDITTTAPTPKPATTPAGGFPPITIATIFTVSAVVTAIVLLLYFKKRRHQAESH